MKCPMCNGSGVDDDRLICYRCGGSGVIEMTNEEWLEQASTEEKAKFLRKIYRDGRDDYVGEWYEQTEADFVEWLKQPHTNEE